MGGLACGNRLDIPIFEPSFFTRIFVALFVDGGRFLYCEEGGIFLNVWIYLYKYVNISLVLSVEEQDLVS